MMVEYTWSEYLASLDDAKSHGSAYGYEFTDNESWDSAMAKMTHGDDKHVSKADALLDKLSDVSEGVPVREWTPSPMGAYPVVPEFLSGMPTCMRSLSPAGELAPLKVVVSTTSSGGLDLETLRRRGVAVLALVMKLQTIRPVDLYVLVEGNDCKQGRRQNLFQMIRLDTRPLSIAHTCFALANAGFARQLTYAHMHRYHSWDGAWPPAYKSSAYESIVRQECNMTPDDLWIRSSHTSDTLLRDSVKWVNTQIAKYTSGEND
jgi:hypothetical protein